LGTDNASISNSTIERPDTQRQDLATSRAQNPPTSISLFRTWLTVSTSQESLVETSRSLQHGDNEDLTTAKRARPASLDSESVPKRLWISRPCDIPVQSIEDQDQTTQGRVDRRHVLNPYGNFLVTFANTMDRVQLRNVLVTRVAPRAALLVPATPIAKDNSSDVYVKGHAETAIVAGLGGHAFLIVARVVIA